MAASCVDRVLLPLVIGLWVISAALGIGLVAASGVYTLQVNSSVYWETGSCYRSVDLKPEESEGHPPHCVSALISGIVGIITGFIQLLGAALFAGLTRSQVSKLYLGKFHCIILCFCIYSGVAVVTSCQYGVSVYCWRYAWSLIYTILLFSDLSYCAIVIILIYALLYMEGRQAQVNEGMVSTIKDTVVGVGKELIEISKQQEEEAVKPKRRGKKRSKRKSILKQKKKN